MQHLRRLYPFAAEMATSLGGVKVPLRAEKGSSAMICGWGSLAEVRRQFRLEGQALFPVPVAEQGDQNDAGEDLTLNFGDFTPVILSATRWRGGCLGAYDEISLNVLTTYGRLGADESMRKHDFLIPYLLTHDPSIRMLPLLTITNSKDATTVNREIFHLPCVYDADLAITSADGVAGDAEGADANARITGIDMSGNTSIPHLMGTSWNLRLSQEREGLRTIKDKWLDIQRTIGLETVFQQRYEARRKLKFTIPHGRSTVKPANRAVNDVYGRRNTPGVVSGVEMNEDAAPCGADCDVVFRNTGPQGVRVWDEGLGDSVSLEGSALGFEPCLTVHTGGIDAIRLLPQRPVLPLHSTDQRQGELKELVEKCQVLLDARRMEQPDEFYLPPNVVDIHKGDMVHQGASWGSGGGGRTS